MTNTFMKLSASLFTTNQHNISQSIVMQTRRNINDAFMMRLPRIGYGDITLLLGVLPRPQSYKIFLIPHPRIQYFIRIVGKMIFINEALPCYLERPKCGVMEMKNSKLVPGIGRDSTER